MGVDVLVTARRRWNRYDQALLDAGCVVERRDAGSIIVDPKVRPPASLLSPRHSQAEDRRFALPHQPDQKPGAVS